MSMDKATAEKMVETFENAIKDQCMNANPSSFLDCVNAWDALIAALTTDSPNRLLEAAKTVLNWYTADSRVRSPVFNALSAAIDNAQVTTDNGERMKPLVQHLQDDLEKVIDKYRDEGLTLSEIIGALEIVKINAWSESAELNEEEEE